ncbi:unnamed protein product [Chilo suppressalis]|uniref:Uncharacterized protein n=1 Tax=Chilo suppressalis TaxID=168631 RepID=A0ABN8BCX8_CHISP|nr:unnamed protein product [Chilo suppressalis]
MLFNFVAVFALIGIVAGRANRDMSTQLRLRMQLIEDCKKYGGEDAWTNLEAASNKFSECVLSEIDAYTVMQIRNVTNNPESLHSIAKKVCAKKSPLLSCTFNFLDKVEPCIDPVLQGRINDSKKAVSEFVDYVCFNDAEVVGKLVSQSAMKCVEDNVQNMYQCLNRAELMDLQSTPIPKRCEIFREGSSCILNSLNTCSDKSYADFFENLLDTVVVGSYCEKGVITDVKVNNI